MNRSNILKVIENLSVVVFFLTWWKYSEDLKYPTMALMIWMTGFVILAKLWGEKLSQFQIISWLVIIFLGGGSLALNNDSIIKWKTTIINFSISIVFLSSHFIGKLTIMERICRGKLHAPQYKIRNLNLFIVFYLLLVAFLNWYVANHYKTADWMYFKTFGLLGLHVIFVFMGMYYIKDYLKDFVERLEK